LNSKKVSSFVLHDKNIIAHIDLGQCYVPAPEKELTHDSKLASASDVEIAPV
jgi:hypothetical protein